VIDSFNLCSCEIFFFSLGSGIEPRTSHMLGKHSTTDPWPSPNVGPLSWL
jgi:hypothetical protein